MTTIPAVVPPLERESRFGRNLPRNAALAWLAAGWSDLRTVPTPSLLYGLVIFLVSVSIVVGLFVLGLGLHPVPGAGRLHGGGPDPGYGSL